ncbi:MAG: molybdopterin-dependent oxidoreductase [Candidatus Methylacidiphilales bacterium]
MKKEAYPAKPTRREFLCKGALAGFASVPWLRATTEVATRAGGSCALLNSSRPDAPYTPILPENQIHSVCLQCNTGCGIKVKLQDGVVTKIDGNPYNPWTLLPHLPAASHMDDAARIDGALCPKGQAGLQTAYDPYRVRQVLKRAGKRGENKWVSIPFAQAIREICQGGKLFEHVPGEENRVVEGLAALQGLKDPKLIKEMGAEIKAYWNEKDAGKKKALLEAFRTKYADHLDALIDPEHPDLGPKNNQLVLMWGRMKGGRTDFYKRFADAFGTINAHGHTTVCQGSLYFTCKAISEQWIGGKFTGGKKFYWMADTEHAEFVLFVGANLFEANYGPPNRTVRLTEGLASGRTTIAVADPRFSKLASKARWWLPLQPGTDAALALAMIRWIIENDRHDKKFLSAANKAAAQALGEKSWCNATWLVEIGADGTPGKLARAADHGLAQAVTRTVPDPKNKKETITYTEKFFLVMQDGRTVPCDPDNAENPVIGDLLVDTTLPDGTRVKSGLQMLLDSAREHTLAEWCEMAGVRERDVVAVARELTSHGKRAAVDIHRGPAQHTNGFYNVLAWMSLNMLLGNFDHEGGMIAASTYDYTGVKGGPFDLKAHPGKRGGFGISSIRHDIAYEKTSLFSGYPAKRNWYPLASDVYEEIIPSIGDAYPYPVKALILYMGAPTYALPAGHTNIEILRDPGKLPLFIANDILIGSTSMYADYIFPDLSFLERWEFHGSHPCVASKVQPVRQPAIAPIPEEVEVFGQKMPIGLEAMLLGIAEELGLPGYGPNGLGEGKALSHPDDFYLRGVANVAYGEDTTGKKAVPNADAREMEIFRQARRHLPASVYDESRWQNIVGESLWPKVVHVLNRGGRFEEAEKAFAGGFHTHPYGKLLNLYQEKTAGVIHSGTGKKYPGYACYLPIRDYHGNEPVALREGYPLQLITHRTITQTKSRTITNQWLTPIMPENAILLHPQDGARLGLATRDEVRVISATNPRAEWDIGPGFTKPIAGRVMLTQTVRPGVISFALGFGHWATGSHDVTINGITICGDKRRASGLHANAAMWVDPALKNTCFFDPVGGSVSFYDTRVKLEKLPRGTLPPSEAILKAV